MPTTLLVFEFLGTSELLIIAVVALIIFGPRKLPEIGRSLGRTLSEFKRASEDFKRTWEYEVELEQRSAGPAQPAGGGVEGMSGSVPAGDASAGALDEGATVARGASWGDVKPQVYVPVGGDVPDFARGSAETRQDDATLQDDAAQPDAPAPAVESSPAPSEGHTGPGEPRDS